MIPETIAKAPNNTSAAIEAGAALMTTPEVRDVHGRPLVFVPKHLDVKDLSHLLPSPARLEQKVTLDTPAAFASRPFWTITRSRTLRAGTSHRAHLVLLNTVAWQEWTRANRQAMSQADFAQFIEDHIPDIAVPAGAELLEVARNFEARKGVDFKSVQRVSDGSVQFSYNEDVQGTSRAGSMKVPNEFILGIAPFEGTPKYQVLARLRYRIEAGGKLMLWFDLLRLQDVLDAAFAAVETEIRAALDGTVRAVVCGQPA
jgi:hypothetical protein